MTLKKRNKRWVTTVQAQFLLRCSDLLKEGFSLHDALQFLQVIFPKQAAQLSKVIERLAKGDAFEQTLPDLGFHNQIITQLALTQQSRQFATVLAHCGTMLLTKKEQTDKLRHLLIYPALLIVFVISMVLTMRQFFLPQMQLLIEPTAQAKYPYVSVVLWVIEWFPHLLLGILLVSLLVFLGLRKWYQRLPALKQARCLVSLPLCGRWFRQYHSSFVSRELAQLLKQGIPLHDMMLLLQQQQQQTLLRELAQQLNQQFRDGQSLADSLLATKLFEPTMSYIIRHGEQTSQLSVKLALYSNECWQHLLADIGRKMTWLQPIIFIGVALFVLIVYLTMLLPMFTMIEGVM